MTHCYPGRDALVQRLLPPLRPRLSGHSHRPAVEGHRRDTGVDTWLPGYPRWTKLIRCRWHTTGQKTASTIPPTITSGRILDIASTLPAWPDSWLIRGWYKSHPQRRLHSDC